MCAGIAAGGDNGSFPTPQKCFELKSRSPFSIEFDNAFLVKESLDSFIFTQLFVATHEFSE
ncbi:unnamed protein product, partial [Rotaria magnacalcarata]